MSNVRKISLGIVMLLVVLAFSTAFADVVDPNTVITTQIVMDLSATLNGNPITPGEVMELVKTNPYIVMKYIKLFLTNIKKYNKYAIRSAKAELKSEVSGSYLNWLWWVIEPLCFMIIYTFVFDVIFKIHNQ